ncbi:MAG TPA: sulfate adenylyltransferase subunit CysD [Burkholderiaceae bacterium]|nr:sulfate adenylyltransferase subunit CysD [Burkholderiaceae bacterium]
MRTDAWLDADVAPAPGPLPEDADWTELDALEAESVHVLREIAAEQDRVALLFSGGKDSAVVLRLAEKAFWPQRMPFVLLHVDTEHNFPEVIAFRDRIARERGHALVVRSVGDSIRAGRVRLRRPDEPRNPHQSVTLLDAIRELGLAACIGGARRDEEKARAKERIFSFRDASGQWDPKDQRPELWSLYNATIDAGENIRVFPLSNWTELDVWQYIRRERIELPSIYFAHEREVVRRGASLVPVTALTPAREGETVERLRVRFRTVGDVTCTAPVESDAADLDAIVLETQRSRLSERGATRLDDQANEAAMELRKREGYF